MISVTLPDGSKIEVPSKRRELKSNEIGGGNRSTFVDEPAPHAAYSFTPVIGGWHARPKT